MCFYPDFILRILYCILYFCAPFYEFCEFSEPFILKIFRETILLITDLILTDFIFSKVPKPGISQQNTKFRNTEENKFVLRVLSQRIFILQMFHYITHKK